VTRKGRWKRARNVQAMSARVFLLGLDAADRHTVGTLLHAGRLPNLARLAAGSQAQPLPSTPLPITPSAWTAAYTGLNPGKTGVLTFERAAGAYRTRIVNSRDVGDRGMHALLPRSGKRVISIGFPMTSPVPDVEGAIVVAGWDAVPESRLCNDPVWEKRLPDFGYRIEDEFSSDEETLRASIERRFRLAAVMAESEPWDCLMLYFGFIDTLGHRLGFGNDVTPRLLEIVDREIGALMERLGAGVELAVCSDHGFGTFARSFSLLQWLESEGYLALRSRLFRGSGEGGIPGIEFMDLDSGVIDWAASRAFCYDAVGSYGGIRLNVRGRYPVGTVDPRDAWRLAEEIRERLLSVVDPVTGTRVIAKVSRREELFWGAHVPEFPELIVEAEPDTVVFVGKRRAVSGGFELEDGVVHRGPFNSHLPDGIWVSSFPVQPGMRIEDVAPTICGVLGVDLPEDRDGIDRSNRRTKMADSANRVSCSSETAEQPYTSEEEELVRRRLEALGYL